MRRIISFPRRPNQAKVAANQSAAAAVAEHNEMATAHGGIEGIGRLEAWHDALSLATSGATRQARLITFGDSLCTRFSEPICTYARSLLPFKSEGLGGTAGNVGVILTPSAGAIASDSTEYSRWITGDVWILPAGGELICNTRQRGHRMALFYCKLPGDGSFKIEMQNDGDVFVEVETISCDSTQGTGVKTWTNTFSTVGRQVRITGVSGTCRIIGLSSVFDNQPSVVANYLYRGGLDLSLAATCPDACVVPVLVELAPDLVFVLANDSVTKYSVWIPAMKRWLAAAAPKSAVLLVGDGPQETQWGGDAQSAEANVYLRAQALANNWAFCDMLQMLGDYANVVRMGWEGDTLHLHASAYNYCVKRANAAFDFFPVVNGVSSSRIVNVSDTENIIKNLHFSRDWTANGMCGGLSPNPASSYDFMLRLGRCFEIANEDGTQVFARFPKPEAENVYKCQLPAHIRHGAQTGPAEIWGSDTPEGAITAPVGSIFHRTNGGAGTCLYVKETGTGNTGWAAK